MLMRLILAVLLIPCLALRLVAGAETTPNSDPVTIMTRAFQAKPLTLRHARTITSDTKTTDADVAVAPTAVMPTKDWTVSANAAQDPFAMEVGLFNRSWTMPPPYAPAMITAMVGATAVARPPLATAETPGPSQALYNAPFYSCLHNFYVNPAGSDANDGSSDHPWLTMQKADSKSRGAGDCVNFAAGTYEETAALQYGGNAPTATGYVVYRCQTLDGCHFLYPHDGTNGGVLIDLRSPGAYFVFDGFEFDGNGTTSMADGRASVCIDSTWDTNRFNAPPNNNSVHHVWILNNDIHHCNLAGIAFSNKEWYYTIHNRVHHNSWTSGNEGSGIGMVVVQCIEAGRAECADTTGGIPGTASYVPSGMDLTYLAPYHVVALYNDVFDNSEARSPIKCGNHTDGNGIIWDTFFNENTKAPGSPGDQIIAYPFQSLIQGNTTHSNGGRGIHVFAANNTTIANNSAYGNGTDICNGSFYLGDLSQSGGTNDIWVNNISQSVLTAADPTCGGMAPDGINGRTTFCGNRNAPLVAGNGRGVVDTHNTYSNNVLYGGQGIRIFDADVRYFDPANNKQSDPLYVSPSTGNFSLNAASPAAGYAKAGYGASSDAGACERTLSKCPGSE